MIPIAHVGHYLWVLYLIPVLVVIAGIVRTALTQRHGARTDGDR